MWKLGVRNRNAITNAGGTEVLSCIKCLVDELLACFARSRDGIDFDSIDKEPVRLFFALLVPNNSAGLHLKALARISRILKSESFRDDLLSFQTSNEIHAAFKQFDEGD